MKKTIITTALLLAATTSPGFSSDEELLREIEFLKKRIAELEKTLKNKSSKEEKLAKDIADIKEKLESMEFHANAVIYYQGASVDKVDGEKISNPSGTGYVADLEFSFSPIKEGQFYMRLHAGEGSGADKILEEKEDALFANLNTLADDNPENEATFKLLEAYYTQTLFDGKLQLTFGKTEPPVFVDDNEFANDEYSQFVGKPFVNNPIIDGEFQFAPLIGLVFSPNESMEISAVVQSNEQTSLSWNGNEWTVKEKSLYDNIFDKPFYAVQFKYSLNFNELPGNYRIYYWNDSADHIKIGEETNNPSIKPATSKGWGIGISFDQMVSERLGIFGRASWANDEVYEVEQFYSFGFSLKGLVYSRPEDTLGIGFAALLPNDKLDNDNPEYHFEGYYRFQISENFAITPDFQLVINPHGNSGNDNILAGMVKAELSF